MDPQSAEFEQDEAGWVALVALPPLSSPTQLAIPAGTAHEMQTSGIILAEFLAAWSLIEPRLRRSLFAYYSSTRNAVDDSGPIIQSEASVWGYVALYSARVPELLPEGRFVQIVGRCTWEEEHGLEVCMRDGAIVYVGPYVGNSHRNPRRGKPGNFAQDA